MSERRTIKAERNNDIRTLFHLYEIYKRETLRNLKNPDETSPQLNALFRNKLVPRIDALVNKLKIGYRSRAVLKLPYEATPFKDLYTAEDQAHRLKKSLADIRREISAVQGITKDILVAYKAEAESAIDEVIQIDNEFRRLYSKDNVALPANMLRERPVVEQSNENAPIRIVSRDGKRRLKFSNAGSIHGELLKLLILHWGQELSRGVLLEKLNQTTTKKGNNWNNIETAMRNINRALSAAGYSRLKLTILGNSFIVTYTDKT